MFSLWRRLGWGPPLWQMNAHLLNKAQEFRPDLIWLGKALFIYPRTLRLLKQLLPSPFLLHNSPDDQLNPDNQSRHYLNSMSLYDLHVTNKTQNIRELRDLGAPEVYFQDKAFCPDTHRPLPVSPSDRMRLGSRVGFIGAYEEARAQSMLQLAKAGIEVRIWGNGWKRGNRLSHPNLRIEGRAVWADEYALAICATDIHLGFLRKANRDLQTARSIEIPACGGFLLAERTGEHLRLFEEGKEAEFFGSNEELLDKVRYYTEHEDIRKQIAMAGRERCLKSGYSNQERMKELFERLGYLHE
ncbi:MAG: glycosyltransferase [Candidatus Scalindua sediminis]|nr:glycosyltransferase [Candidatus Scalindua sediminis]